MSSTHAAATNRNLSAWKKRAEISLKTFLFFLIRANWVFVTKCNHFILIGRTEKGRKRSSVISSPSPPLSQGISCVFNFFVILETLPTETFNKVLQICWSMCPQFCQRWDCVLRAPLKRLSAYLTTAWLFSWDFLLLRLCFEWAVTIVDYLHLNLDQNLLFISVRRKSPIVQKSATVIHMGCPAVTIDHARRGQRTLWWKMTKCFVMGLSLLNLRLRMMTNRRP